MEEETKEEVINNYLHGFDYHIGLGILSRKDIESFKKKLGTLFNKKMDDGTPREYINYDQGAKAYSKILETGITAQEALEYVALYYGKDKEWVEEVKNNNYLHAKSVFTAHKEHEVQKAMTKDGTLRPKALKYSRTPNDQLRELHSQRKLHTTLNTLKGEQKELSSDVEELKVQSLIADSNIDVLMSTLEINPMSTKEKASKLKQAGFSQSKISYHLGIHINTIKRWWKTI